MNEPLKTYYTYNGTAILASSPQAAACWAYGPDNYSGVSLWYRDGAVWVEHVIGGEEILDSPPPHGSGPRTPRY